MNEIYLLNHRAPSYEPFKSIMRLPKEEAFALAAKLNEDKTCDANDRFGPSFAEYYETRLRAENWLYENFKGIGGKPQTKHPLYFYVYGWDLASKFWPVNITEKIPLSGIEPCDISFSIGDSCDEKNRQLPFMKDKLYELISTHGSIEYLLAYVKSQIGYGMIEAQLWNDKYVGKG